MASLFVERFVDTMESNLGGALNFKKNEKYLEERLDELTALELDIRFQLNTVESSFSYKKRKYGVAHWLANVARVKEEFWNLEAKMGANGWGRNLWGAQVQRLGKEVDELIGKGRFQGELVLEVCETKAEPLLVTKVFGKAFQVNLEKIWAWLMDDQVSSIGIYGTGGVGKTTLVTHINNRLLERPNLFRNIYWIIIPQDSNIRKLQDSIAKIIEFDFDGEDNEETRATKLLEALLYKLDNEQKFVIILDDLWNSFSLKKVGIPMSCKLILTTRSFDICQEMDCHKIIQLKPLLEEESWNLFIEKLGNHATLSSRVEKIAKSIVRECDGLPLVVSTVARSMRGVDDVSEWKNVLVALKQSTNGPDDMDDKVFKALNLSYERLRDQALQECFLSCALFPKVGEIMRDELIEYLISKNIIEDVNSRPAQIDIGHTMLNKLENVCLLEGSLNKVSVKMNNLVRQMAINKRNGYPKAMVEACKHMETIEWLLLSTSIILEVTSLISEQLEYALLGMIMAFLGLVLCMIELFYKARKEGATFEWNRGSLPWIYSQKPRHELFGTTIEYFGLVAALWQLLPSTFGYFYARKRLQNPIKISIIMLLFCLCLLVSKLVKKYSRVAPRREPEP